MCDLKSVRPQALEIARQARDQGCRILVDMCDNHFERPNLGDFYRELCAMADAIVASTPAMAEVVLANSGRPATVIDDPFEAPQGRPRFQPSRERLQLAWFGNPVNFDTCVAMLPSLAELSRERPLALHVVTNEVQGVIPTRLAALTAPYGPAFQAHFIAWTPAAAWQAITAADLVVVPSHGAAHKLVKSPNRVVEPLRLGRFVVAYPLPSYQPLEPYVWLGDDMSAGIRWALKHPAQVLSRLQRRPALRGGAVCPGSHGAALGDRATRGRREAADDECDEGSLGGAAAKGRCVADAG